MPDPRVNLKNCYVAAVLAFLIPGAGHWYQGRHFKAAIYSVCILGLFGWGMSLAEWKAVNFTWDEMDRQGPRRGKTIGFLAQVMVGTPSLTALVQWYRYTRLNDDSANASSTSDLPVDAEFHGFAKHETPEETWEGPVSGRLQLKLEQGQFGPEVRGEFRGTLETENRREVQFALAGPCEVAPRLLASGNVTLKSDGKNKGWEYSSSRRYIQCRVIETRKGFDSPAGQLEGTIPRPFVDWFQMPLEDDAVQDLNRRLGRRYEVALLFTWIAGLLNLLAVWDAYEGPAYGYGDEVEPAEGDAAAKLNSTAVPTVSTVAPAVGVTTSPLTTVAPASVGGPMAP